MGLAGGLDWSQLTILSTRQVTVCAATDLQSTKFMTRLKPGDKEAAKKMDLDPYVAIDVDELYVERTSTKRKTNDPDWNETFSTDLLRSAEEVGFTVFHDATVPPDDFIANCRLSLPNLIEKADQPLHDIWLDLACLLYYFIQCLTCHLKIWVVSVNDIDKSST